MTAFPIQTKGTKKKNNNGDLSRKRKVEHRTGESFQRSGLRQFPLNNAASLFFWGGGLKVCRSPRRQFYAHLSRWRKVIKISIGIKSYRVAKKPN